ncbi:MAG: sulfatase [Planctomycetota bacterium]
MTARTPILMAGLALLVACGGDESAPLPHVIVISLDTVRADRLGCYGGAEGATPRLDELAARADLYRSCTATSSWTLPSHASMFTGLFPFEHGTHGFRTDEPADNVHPLHPDHATLAEEMRVVGYHTAGLVANTVYLAVRYGVAQGFEEYEPSRRPGPALTDRALQIVDERIAADDGRPLFLFLNYMDTHRPYLFAPLEEIARMPPDEHPAALLEALCARVMNEGAPPGELGERVAELYGRALTVLDAEIGRLLDGLDERGVLDGAVVVVTSDHGEAFGTHGIVEHAKDVYEPLVAVPLLVKRSGQRAGRKLDEPASLVDVPGLVADAIGGAAGEELAGRFPRVPGAHPVTAEIHFARPREVALYAGRFQRQRFALREGRYKVIVEGDEVELYDLSADPGELVDLAEREPSRAEAMVRSLRELRSSGAYAGERLMPQPPTPVQRKDIDELGYGGGR